MVSFKAAYDYRVSCLEKFRLDIGSSSAFRLVNGAADNFENLAIDVYAGFGLIHVYSSSWLKQFTELQTALLELPCINGLYLVDRSKKISGNKSEFLAGSRAENDVVEIKENSIKYIIKLCAGAPTGLYLDQRENRKKVAKLLCDGSLLNTFSYTASFSLAAAINGSQTTSVDLSKSSLDHGVQNFKLNGVDTSLHEFVAGDVFDFLVRYKKKGRKFKGVLLDPPTFSRGKKGVFTVEKKYADLIKLAFPLVEKDGFIFAFANTHRLSFTEWKNQVLFGLEDNKASFEITEFFTQDVDFRDNSEDKYLKGLVLKNKFK